MSFFIRKHNNKNQSKFANKRKNQSLKKPLDSNKSKKSLNEEISSDSEEDEDYIEGNNRKRNEEGYESSSSESRETAQQKKIRLAKKYLEDIEREEKDKNDTEFIDKSVISGRLRDDILEQSGRLHKKVADNYLNANLESVRTLKNGHHLSITCVVMSCDSKFIYSASKDCSVIKWDFETNKKLNVINGGKKGTEAKHVGHTAHILSMAISSDNKFLSTGCLNKIIHIWNPETMQLIHTFRGHRGPVSGLAFRKGFHLLFSSSFDRSVKVWNLDEMSYIETLFGHQDSIMAIDSLIRERAITAGGRDSSVRIWKIPEESQLVFHGSNHSIDCVKLIDEQHFVSASDNGSICLWSALKKKPLTTYALAHGMGSSDANWITAIAVLRNTDLIASGSSDGCIRLWKCSEDFKRLEPLFSIPVIGFVNSIEFTNNGQHLIVGLGQEHRLGRWWKIKEAKNCVLIIPLVLK